MTDLISSQECVEKLSSFSKELDFEVPPSLTQLYYDSSMTIGRIYESITASARESIVEEPDLSITDVAAFEFMTLFDPGIEEASAYRRAPEKVYADCGQELFSDKVKEDDLYLSKRFYNGLAGESIDLQFSLVDSMCFMPMCLALQYNHSVTSLNLKGNHLSPDACYHLALLINTNKTLQELNLCDCRMGPKGAEKLGESLEHTKTLTSLDLSSNELGDAGLHSFIMGLGYNNSIKSLYLNNNKLTHLSGWHLADIFIENSSILHIDLSWNDIMEEHGIKRFLTSLSKLNETLESINLAWNGLNGEIIPTYFKTFLIRFKTIKHLDLSNNRLQGDIAVEQFARGINSSDSLQTLNLSYNPFQPEHVLSLLTKIAKSKSLKKLFFSNIWLSRKMYHPAVEIHNRGGPLLIIDGLLGIKDDAVSDSVAQILLLKRAHYLGLKPKKKKRRKEFGFFLLRLQEDSKLKPMKKKAFLKILNGEKLLLDEGMENELVKRFPERKKMVDVPRILELYMELYPETALPKKKGKKIMTIDDMMKELFNTIVNNIVQAKFIAKSKKQKMKKPK